MSTIVDIRRLKVVIWDITLCQLELPNFLRCLVPSHSGSSSPKRESLCTVWSWRRRHYTQKRQ